MRSAVASVSFASVTVALLSISSVAQGAAKVELTFLPPGKYTDVGDGTVEQERNLKELGDYFVKIGAKGLADGQTITISFQDIDLAGRPKLFHRSGGDYRILTGQADWPRIRLQWVLHTPGTADRSGDDTLADMNYLWHAPTWRNTASLFYEKRMVDEWFRKTFGTVAAGTGSTAATAP